MPHTFALKLITPSTASPANDDINVIAPSHSDLVEARILELHRNGMSRRRIADATGATEHYVRKVTNGVPVTSKQPTTPFDRSIGKCYPLATSKTGIKDYQLRQILHECYGVEWNTETGKFESSYTSDHLNRVRTKVRTLAKDNGDVAFFVMDWVNTCRPTESRIAIERCALRIEQAIVDIVDEYMDEYRQDAATDEIELTDAQRKQAYAARRHILKLAIREYHSEPTETLLERSLTLTDALDQHPDVPMVSVRLARKDHFPEPTGSDAFLDHCEAKGWLHPAHYAEVDRAMTAAGY